MQNAAAILKLQPLVVVPGLKVVVKVAWYPQPGLDFQAI